ncbi:cytokine-like nuclear factor N-PAC [Uloborus diversus]|uniref:cytokine-like nuclear factor N-PAC n=1 Tax=Uloborus diversus TaxID=327109 RepID=UPI002409CE9B|nr:cytokine-like nuclear factor N-PAC [Uloborus diversus]XP_054708881.1 cytokine-like nuclear factor N-PAC [Uloborus diversus]
MSSSPFSIGDLVWAKMKGFPPWPAKITEPPVHLKSLARSKKGHQCCFFFVSENYSWIRDDQVFKHSDSMVPKSMKRKSLQYRQAVELFLQECPIPDYTKTLEIVEDIAEIQPSTSSSASKRKISSGKLQKSKKLKQQGSDTIKKTPRKRGSGTQNIKQDAVEARKKKRLANMRGLRIKWRKSKTNVDDEDDDEDDGQHSPSSLNETSSSIMNGTTSTVMNETTSSIRNGTTSSITNGTTSSIMNETTSIMNETASLMSETAASILNGGASSSCSNENALQWFPGYNPNIVPKRPKVPPYIELPPTPEFDMIIDMEDMKKREIKPSSKKFGFLGLGFIGQILAKRILCSGHDLTIWNRSPEKCEDFFEAGAHSAQTPADVVAASDVTFCCFSDTEAVKGIVFDNCGVLSAMDASGKGFCVLNTIDPSESIQINEAIVNKGGFYLEAFVHGTRSMAKDGELLVIAAGNRAVFDDCTSCFQSFAKNAYFIDFQVGKAAIVNVLLLGVAATSCLALSETLHYTERRGMSIESIVEYFEETRLSNFELIKNASAIDTQDFSTDISVKLIQQALHSAVNLSDADGTQTLITALVNEKYKNASLLRYFDHDIAAVHQTLK